MALAFDDLCAEICSRNRLLAQNHVVLVLVAGGVSNMAVDESCLAHRQGECVCEESWLVGKDIDVLDDMDSLSIEHIDLGCACLRNRLLLLEHSALTDWCTNEQLVVDLGRPIEFAEFLVFVLENRLSPRQLRCPFDLFDLGLLLYSYCYFDH